MYVAGCPDINAAAGTPGEFAIRFVPGGGPLICHVNLRPENREIFSKSKLFLLRVKTPVFDAMRTARDPPSLIL